jgi:transposase
MSKYSIEEKLEAILRVKNDSMSIGQSAKILGVKHENLSRWIQLYDKHGIKGIINSGASYDGNFKVMVVEYMHANHLSCRNTATKFCIKGTSTVNKWERIYYEEGPGGLLKSKHSGRPPKNLMKKKDSKKKISKQTEGDLIAEVQRLRMENEYLKKLQALVQERIDRENGKKPE